MEFRIALTTALGSPPLNGEDLVFTRTEKGLQVTAQTRGYTMLLAVLSPGQAAALGEFCAAAGGGRHVRSH